MRALSQSKMPPQQSETLFNLFDHGLDFCSHDKALLSYFSYIPIINQKACFVAIDLWAHFSPGAPQREPTIIVAPEKKSPQISMLKTNPLIYEGYKI